MGINYDRLIAPLVEAIKSQQDIIDAQNKRIENYDANASRQQAEIDLLKSQLKAIEDKLEIRAKK